MPLPRTLTLANYRAFSRPTELELRPLTLLYGWNSAGKSALLRLLPLLAHSARPSATAVPNVAAWQEQELALDREEREDFTPKPPGPPTSAPSRDTNQHDGADGQPQWPPPRAVAGVTGSAAGGVFLWEALARGVATSRRGFALGITFGAGPLLLTG